MAGVIGTMPFQNGVPGLLGLVSLIPFFLILIGECATRRSFREVFSTGWIAGFGFFLGLLYWIGLLVDSGIPIRGITGVGWVALSAALAIFFGLFSLLVRLGWGVLPPVILIPAAWGLVEYFRSLGPLGFPWGSIGYTLSDYTTLIQSARFGGIYLLSSIVVGVNVFVSQAVIAAAGGNVKRVVIYLVAGLLVVFIAGVDGVIRMSRPLPGEGRPVRVAVIQPNILAEDKWTKEFKAKAVDILSDLTREAIREEKIDLAIWPETSVPSYVRQEFSVFKKITSLARETGVVIVFGHPDADYLGRAGYRYYNAGMLLNKNGIEEGAYRKIHLVPFGERIPLSGKVDWITRIDLGQANFYPGSEFTVLSSGKAGHFSVTICYEAIFPALCRQFAQAGAMYFVNLTNDAWFGTTAAPDQHADMARVRCVELGIPLARAANTGISLLADSFGRTIDSKPLMERGYAIGAIRPRQADTFYYRWGDWLPRLEGAVLALGILLAFARHRIERRRSRSSRD